MIMEEMSYLFTPDMKRERFLNRTLEIERTKSTHLYVLTRDQCTLLITEIEEAQKATKKTPVQQRRIKRFEIVENDGEKRVILRASRQDKHLRYFLPIEEIYDVIDKTHITLSHAGRDKLMAETALHYANITREMVVLYLSMCEVCARKKNKINKAHMNANNTNSDYEILVSSRCQIDIIDFQNKPDGKFKFIMVYQDHKTKFTLLRALKTESPSEIANNLIDIFLIIGAPCILQSNNRETLVDDIIRNATILWPELVMLSGKIDNPKEALANITQEIENYINNWLEVNKSTNWSESLRYVQFMKNRTYHPEIKKAPYKAMFGMAPKTGLGTIPLSPELLHVIKTVMPFKPVQPQIGGGSSVNYEGNSPLLSNTESDYETLVNSRCQIDIIDLQNKPDGKFKFIMVYQEHKTKYTLLRALETESPLEIANNLIDVFRIIGAPCILQSNNRKALVDDIIRNASILWPELVMLSGKIDNPIGALENINQEIENYVNNWIEDHKSTNWAESLRHVQFIKNRTYNPEIKKSPHKAMFGMTPKTGLGTIPLPPELLHAIKSGISFKPVQPQIGDGSVEYEDNSSTFKDTENSAVTVAENNEAMAIKEEIIYDITENDIDSSTPETIYLNLHDSNITVDSEDIEVRAIKRKTMLVQNNQDVSTSSYDSSHASAEVGNIELPVKKFKAST